MVHERRVQRSGPADMANKSVRDIHALNASILIISQKLKYIVRNEKILGRNLIVLNRKVRELVAGGISGAAGASGKEVADLQNEVARLSQEVSSISASHADMQDLLNRVKDKSATAESVQEIKYLLDSINPVEFVTAKDVEEIVEKKLGKKTGKK
ncbi:MAG: hypothetical protein V1676_03745 [Candidatus Diapherotrites archaeon]